MRTYLQHGAVLTLTAPTGGVTAGTGLLIGSLFVVPMVTAAEAAEFDALVCGVVSHAKTDSQAWTEGQKIYWDAGNAVCTNVATAGPLIGVAAAAVAVTAGLTTGYVRLNGVAPAASEGPQAAIADLTMGTNVTAATANGSLEDSAATNPSDANFNNNMKELGTKLNAILAALRTTGIIAAS